jgi:cyclophilin family peptidyl-prolyl cis-trans isomerase
VFRARFTATKGPFVVTVHRKWAPRGADRFYNLVRAGFYDPVSGCSVSCRGSSSSGGSANAEDLEGVAERDHP